MKSLLCVLYLAGFLAIAHTFPGVPRDSNESDESDEIFLLTGLPRNPFFNAPAFRPDFHIPDTADDDADESFGLHPFRFSFDPSGLFQSVQDAMNKLKSQLASSISGLPRPSSLNPWRNVPEGANTTSTTKVIDGHVVTINETIYKSEDDKTYVRFRIVDVQPENTTGVTADTDAKDTTDQSSGEVTDKTTNANSPTSTSPTSPAPAPTPTPTESNKEDTTPSRSVETVEEFGNNEIPDNQVDPLKA